MPSRRRGAAITSEENRDDDDDDEKKSRGQTQLFAPPSEEFVDVVRAN